MGGSALAVSQVNRQVQRDLTYAEKLAFPILFLLALWVFRSVVAALLPLLCGALTILGALLLLRVLDQATPISTYALNIVTGAGLGLGIDYSLLLVSRYREELARRGPGIEAVRATLATAGRTVAFSSVTVGVAIATLAVFPLGFMRSMGIAGGLVGPLAGLIALTVLPALFVLLGPRVDALSVRRRPRSAGEGRQGGWYRLAHALMRRPWPVALAATALLVVLGLPFLSVRFTGVDASVLPAQVSSRVVDTALRRGLFRVGRHPGLRRRAGERSRGARLRGCGSQAAGRRARAAAPAAGPRRVGGDGRRPESLSSPAPRSGSCTSCGPCRAMRRVGGSTAQYLDQRAHDRIPPPARARAPVRGHVPAPLPGDPVARPAAEDAGDERADPRGDAGNPRVRLPGRPARGSALLPKPGRAAADPAAACCS